MTEVWELTLCDVTEGLDTSPSGQMLAYNVPTLFFPLPKHVEGSIKQFELKVSVLTRRCKQRAMLHWNEG